MINDDANHLELLIDPRDRPTNRRFEWQISEQNFECVLVVAVGSYKRSYRVQKLDLLFLFRSPIRFFYVGKLHLSCWSILAFTDNCSVIRLGGGFQDLLSDRAAPRLNWDPSNPC